MYKYVSINEKIKSFKKNIEVDSDKSLSIRSILIASQAVGVSKIANLLNRRYLYTINFAVQNPDQNIAPYLAVTQVFDANLILLDSIADKLTDEVKASKYGVEFLNLLEQRRKMEAN